MVMEFRASKDAGRYIEPDSVKDLMQKLPEKYQVLALLLFMSGKRISEALDVHVNDINFSENVITFHLRKKRVPTDQAVSIDPYTMQQIREHIEIYDIKDKLWNVSVRRIEQLFKRAGMETISGKPVTPHVLRHSSAIDQLKHIQHPEDIIDIQRNLAHSDMRITMSYLDVVGHKNKDLVNRRALFKVSD